MVYGESLKLLDVKVVLRGYKEMKRRIEFRYGNKICSQLANSLSSTIKEVKQTEGWLAIRYNGRSDGTDFVCVKEDKVFLSKSGSIIIPICKVGKNERPKHKDILESLEYRLDGIMFKVFSIVLDCLVEEGKDIGELVLMVEKMYEVNAYRIKKYIDNYTEGKSKDVFDTFKIINALNPQQKA
jgi:hypothetical protein